MSFEFDGTLIEADRNLVDAQKMGDMGIEVGSMVVSIATQGNAIINNNFLYLYELSGAESSIYCRASLKSPILTLVDGMMMYGKGSATMNGNQIRAFPFIGITNVSLPSNDIFTDINTFFFRIRNNDNTSNSMFYEISGDTKSIILDSNQGNTWDKEGIAVIDKTNNQVFAYYRPNQTTGDYYLGGIFDITLLDRPFFVGSPYSDGTQEDYGLWQKGSVSSKLYPELITPILLDTCTQPNGTTDYTDDTGNNVIITAAPVGACDIQNNKMSTATNGNGYYNTDGDILTEYYFSCDWLNCYSSSSNRFQPRLPFRYQDNNNYFYSEFSSTGWSLVDRNGGSPVQRDTVSVSTMGLVDNTVYTEQRRLTSTEMKHYLNGQELYYASTKYNTLPGWGIYSLFAGTPPRPQTVDNIKMFELTKTINP